MTNTLDDLRIASPCTESWDAMAGNDRARHCDKCALSVFNLSGMTREDATALVQRTEGRVCVRFYRRADGTVLTADCPVGLRAVRRRVGMVVRAVAALFLGAVGLSACSGDDRSLRARMGDVQRAVVDPLPPDAGDSPPRRLMGEVEASSLLERPTSQAVEKIGKVR